MASNNNIQDPATIGVAGLKGINVNHITTKDIESIPQTEFKNSKDVLRLMNLASEFAVPQYIGDVPGLNASVYDKKATTREQLNDLNEVRAQSQSWITQLGNALAKGAVIAGTTIADGLPGLIAGITNIATNTDKIKNSEHPIETFFDLGIENPYSQQLVEINNKMEEILPNYYTKAEQEDPWYEHIASANFIGDKFLKNLGFLVGMAVNMKASAGLATKAMKLKTVRDAFKGAVTTASGRVLNTAAEIEKAYKTGDAFIDGVKLTDDFGKAATKLKHAEWTIKTIGSAFAAQAEARMEAISNSKAWADIEIQLVNDHYNQAVNNIEGTLFQEHPEWFKINTETGRSEIIDPKGHIEWENRVKQLSEQKDKALTLIGASKAEMSNRIFGLNLALLTAGNFYQAGKFLAGGFKSGRIAKNLVKGNLQEGYTASKEMATKGILKGLGTLPLEGNEEMTQAVISETTGQKYASKLNEFYGAKLDPEAEEKTLSWLEAIHKGVSNIYGDTQQWEQFGVGFLTAALGIPSFKMVETKSGRKMPSVSLNGELWESFREAKILNKEAISTAEALNKWIKDPATVAYYQGIVRHTKLQKEEDTALNNGDAFSFNNAAHAKMVSDAIMFDKAGRLDDLYSMIDNAANVTAEDAQDIKKDMVNQAAGVELLQGDAVAHVKKQAEEMRAKVDQYVKVANDLKTLYGDNLAPEILEEMTFTTTQIGDWEKRFESIHNKVKENLENIINRRNTKYFGKNVDKKLESVLDYNVSDLLNTLQSKEVIEMLNRDVKNFETDKNASLQNQQLYNDLSDMLKIYQARNEAINKYSALSSNPELFDEANYKLVKEGIETRAKKIITDTASSLNNVTTVSELKSSLKDVDDEMISSVLEEIKKSDNTELKEVVNKFEQIQDLKKTYSELLNSENQDDPAFKEAAAYIMLTIEDSDSIDEINDKLQLPFTNLSPEAKTIVDNLLQKYDNLSQSARTTKVDSNQSNKKVKNTTKTATRKPFSIFDAPDEPTADAGMEEEDNISTKKSDINNPEVVEVISKLEDLPIDKLKDVADGKINLPEVPKEEIKTVQKLANVIYDTKAAPTAQNNNTLEDVKAIEVSQEEADEKHQSILRSTNEPKYDFISLMDRTLRRMVVRENPIVKVLDELGSYEFVDNGSLGLIRKHAPSTPIKFVITNNPVLVKNNKPILVLAIEVTPEILKIVKPVKTFEGHDGKTYQAVGSLGFTSKNIESIDHFNKLTNAIMSEASESDNPNNFVSSEFESVIDHIYSGRIVKSSETEGIRTKVVNQKFLKGTPLHLGIYYASNKSGKNGNLAQGSLHTPSLSEYDQVAPLNYNNQNLKGGSIWLMVQAADGVYYPKAIQIARFTNEDYDLQKNKNSPIIKKLLRDLTIFSDASKSDYIRSLAKYEIESMLYFPDNSPHLMFNGDKVFISGIESNIKTDLDPETKAVMLLNTIYESGMNLRFQIKGSHLTDQEYLNDLMESEILTTDLLQPNNINASFDVAPVNLTTGKPIVKEEGITTGHTGQKGINANIAQSTVMYNNKKYAILKDGTIFLNGEQLTDNNEIQEVLLTNQIIERTISPIAGDNNLYIGFYNDGTEFGILNNHLVKGEELLRLKNKAEARFKKMQAAKNMAQIEGEIPQGVFDNAKSGVGLIQSENIIPEEEYNKFVDKGIVSKARLDSIASKVISKETLSTEEQAILTSKTSEINELIRTKFTDDLFAIEDNTSDKKPELDSPKIEDTPPKDVSLTSTFDPNKTKSIDALTANINVDNFIRGSRKIITGLGFKSIAEFKDFVNDPQNRLPSLDTINTKQEFDSLLDIIKNCR